MGFSQIAVFTLIAAATLFFFSTAAEKGFAGQAEWHDAWVEAEARSHARLHSDFVIDSGVYAEPPGGSQNPATFTFTMNNTGSITLSVAKMSYTIAEATVGEIYYAPSSATSSQVDGVTSDVWAPGSTLVVTFDVEADFPKGGGNPDPTTASATTEYGNMAFWRA